MKAGLPALEVRLLQRWRDMGLFGKLREGARGREKFILHDGPPYANGNLHAGTAMNKILKDIVNRSQQMLGKDANYVPGWDCHGLPIEWRVEQDYRERGRAKDEVPLAEFRGACRAFAEHWIDVQREEFRRLGVEGDWEHPYTTMSFAAEAQIAAEVLKFLMNGALYRGAKPVLWSVAEQTALAEAEVEYREHTSTTIHVRFPVLEGAAHPALDGASLVIWTTTPWTIPGNRAVAVAPNQDYARIEVKAVAEGSLARVGEFIVLAEPRIDPVCAEAGISAYEVRARLPGAEVTGARCAHPLRGRGYDFEVAVLGANFVVMDQGTGLVHIAPGHGTDDFVLGSAHGLDAPDTVAADGCYHDDVALFAGRSVFEVDDEVAAALDDAGALLARGRLVHEYPHSWRSKKPLIFRNTPQWFISMTENGLKEVALRAIEEVRWVPASGRNRIRAMVENRTEWVLSRQRAWGVPIPLFVDRHSGEPLRDAAVNARIVEIFAAEGSDSWFAGDARRFLGDAHNAADFDMVRDIAEVWFDSGATHSFVLEGAESMAWPASLYLEGTDQHRGWFQSSLLEACGTRGRAPFEAVLTHGFVLDERGHKMSKSLGNVVAPQEITDTFGAEILRVWVAASDYTEDLRIGPDIVRHHVDSYRRLRNTLRFLLGNLKDFSDAERLDSGEMPELERWVLHRISELDSEVRRCCEDFDFHTLFTTLYNFCTAELSAFYLDVRKDSLYCDRADAPRRRAARTVLDTLFSHLTAWFAPVLCFTAEEAWLSRGAGREDSVHLRCFPEAPARWRDAALAERWHAIRGIRRVITGALEVERRDKRIGSSLEAHVVVYATKDHAQVLDGVDLAEVAIASSANLGNGEPPSAAFTTAEMPGVAVVVELAQGTKCERCWQVLTEVKPPPSSPELGPVCKRCAAAIAALSPAAAE